MDNHQVCTGYCTCPWLASRAVLVRTVHPIPSGLKQGIPRGGVNSLCPRSARQTQSAGCTIDILLPYCLLFLPCRSGAA